MVLQRLYNLLPSLVFGPPWLLLELPFGGIGVAATYCWRAAGQGDNGGRSERFRRVLELRPRVGEEGGLSS
jgi:hypothetical protein